MGYGQPVSLSRGRLLASHKKVQSTASPRLIMLILFIGCKQRLGFEACFNHEALVSPGEREVRQASVRNTGLELEDKHEQLGVR